MSAAALQFQPLVTFQSGATAVSPRWLVGLTAIVVGVAFFVAGHDIRTSLAEAYTQSADEMEIAAGGGNALRRVAFVLLGGWGCLLLTFRRATPRIDPLLLGGIGALLMLAAMSFVWSDDAGMSARRLVTLVCCTIAAAGVARAFSQTEICWLALAITGTFVVAGVLSELLLGTFRPWAAGYRFAGTVHPNTQGAQLATLCFATLALMPTCSGSRGWLRLVFGAGLLMLVLTKSRGACAATLLAIGSTQLIKVRAAATIPTAAVAACVAGLAVWVLWVLGIDPINDFREVLLLGREEEAETLTGRSVIWPEVVRFVSERPWLGYGYESFWTAGRIDEISAQLGWGLREAHNAYLEVLLWLGIVGLALVILVAIAGMFAARRDWKATGDTVCLFPLSLVVFGLANACFESGMVVVSIVPFMLGCSLLRRGMFCDAECIHRRQPHECV
jgi:O-antigen ligase